MKQKRTPNQEKVWDNIATKWNIYKTTIQSEVEKFLEYKKGKILDLGCGSGRNFPAFSKDTEIYGIDFSQTMLDHAKVNQKRSKQDITLKKAASDKLPFKKNFFDAAICIALLHCIPSEQKRKKTLKEIYRTLKPNSEVLISVWSKSQKRLKNKPKSCFIPWTSVGEERYTYIYDKPELEKQVKKAGFEILRSREARNIIVHAKKL